MLEMTLHPAQERLIYGHCISKDLAHKLGKPDAHRIKYATAQAGRRGGKTVAAVLKILQRVSEATKGVAFYVAPTQQQCRDIAWGVFQELLKGYPVVYNVHEASIKIDGCRPIYLKGADRPDTMRGVSLCYAVLDEYADMKPNVLDEIIMPALADSGGGCLVIGTPKGKNHFHALVEQAKVSPDWINEHWTTYDNPAIPKENIDALKSTMSRFAFEQEIMAKFTKSESELFKQEWIKTYPSDTQLPKDGTWYTAVDLAGFTDYEQQIGRKTPNLDSTAIASVFVDGKGTWWVDDIEHGRYTAATTAAKCLAPLIKNKSTQLGIEKGVIFQSLVPNLRELARRQGVSMVLKELSHKNQDKVSRIQMALGARLENGKIKFRDAPFLPKFTDQLFDIPSSKNHDDLPDALSLISQMVPKNASSVSFDDFEQNYLALDRVSTDYWRSE